MDYAVFVSNHLVVDKTLWKVYLMGLTVDQAVSYVSKKREVASTSSMELAALRHFVTTQYRNYELLEHPLHHPPILHTHPHFPLPKPTINTLIQSYYALMPAVLRCILGKKLSTKTRKELEDYGERVGLMRSGCRRMFENLRRIARDVDEKMDPVESVIKGYLLDRDLACQYVNTIFLSSYRFDTTKRKLSHLEFSDFEHVAALFFTLLTSPSSPPLSDIDPQLPQDARDIRSMLFSQKSIMDSFRGALLAYLAGLKDNPRAQQVGVAQHDPANLLSTLQRAPTPILKLLRSLLTLTSTLPTPKLRRTLFIDMHTQLIEPASQLTLRSKDLALFWHACQLTFERLELSDGLPDNIKIRWKESFKRIVQSVGDASVWFWEKASERGVELTTAMTGLGIGIGVSRKASAQ